MARTSSYILYIILFHTHAFHRLWLTRHDAMVKCVLATYTRVFRGIKYSDTKRKRTCRRVFIRWRSCSCITLSLSSFFFSFTRARVSFSPAVSFFFFFSSFSLRSLCVLYIHIHILYICMYVSVLVTGRRDS